MNQSRAKLCKAFNTCAHWTPASRSCKMSKNCYIQVARGWPAMKEAMGRCNCCSCQVWVCTGDFIQRNNCSNTSIITAVAGKCSSASLAFNWMLTRAKIQTKLSFFTPSMCSRIRMSKFVKSYVNYNDMGSTCSVWKSLNCSRFQSLTRIPLHAKTLRHYMDTRPRPSTH